mgnify:CR=1 FL=1
MRPDLTDITIVIDRSGSMSGLPLQMARQAAKSAAELLGPQDQIAVIAFEVDMRLQGGWEKIVGKRELARA